MPPSSEPSSVVRLSVADVLDKKVFSFKILLPLTLAISPLRNAGRRKKPGWTIHPRMWKRQTRPNTGQASDYFCRLTVAREYLSSRGVDVGPFQEDSGGNHFFRFRTWKEMN
jgi:hypothetical protein